jgi:CBS domain-containing protein
MGETPVEDLMTEPVLTVAATDTADDVAGAMAREDIKSVVVIDDDCAVEGIFTATDYMELAIHGTETTTVGDCMTAEVVTVEPSADVETAAARMNDHDISHLPVVDADDQVTGMLTSTDLTTCLAA